jgi:hypothetical protein
MENQKSRERSLEEQRQDSIAAEEQDKNTDRPEKDIISIKDVIDEQSDADPISEMPQDEQQYENFPKAKDAGESEN